MIPEWCEHLMMQQAFYLSSNYLKRVRKWLAPAHPPDLVFSSETHCESVLVRLDGQLI